jgi:hypothetical protein
MDYYLYMDKYRWKTCRFLCVANWLDHFIMLNEDMGSNLLETKHFERFYQIWSMVVAMSRQTRIRSATKTFAATGPSNSRQTRVKLAAKIFAVARYVKLTSNSRQIGNKPFSSNRSVKLASNVYMPFQLNFMYEYMHIHVNIQT